MSMIKTILHLFKIHGKMVFGNPSVVIEDMLSVTPKSFNAVNMVFTVVGKGLVMVQTMVLAPAFQRIIAMESIRVVHRPFSGMCDNMHHQFLGCHLLHDFGVHPSIPFQKAQNNAFSDRSSSSLAFSATTKIALVYLNLSLQLACLQLCYMIDRFAQTLIDTGNYLIIQGQITSHTISRLLLVETSDNANFLAQTLERFLFSTRYTSTFDIAAMSFTNLKRSTENTLSSSQKVGCTVENVISSSNHKGILTLSGYEIH